MDADTNLLESVYLWLDTTNVSNKTPWDEPISQIVVWVAACLLLVVLVSVIMLVINCFVDLVVYCWQKISNRAHRTKGYRAELVSLNDIGGYELRLPYYRTNQIRTKGKANMASSFEDSNTSVSGEIGNRYASADSRRGTTTTYLSETLLVDLAATTDPVKRSAPRWERRVSL